MLKKLLADAAQQINSDSARLDAELLAMRAFSVPRSFIYSYPEFVPDSEQMDGFNDLLNRRIKGEPIAYLLGEREFWSLSLSINSSVLIPRPETELLVELALKEIEANKNCVIADLGTGSGAIALALAAERKNAQIFACDLSESALQIARNNASALAVTNVEFLHSDWFANFPKIQFDLIVSNPPYIAESDPHLNLGDCRFEPKNALASGVDGLDAIRQIISQAPEFLKTNAHLLIEHGFAQGESVRELFAQNGYQNICTERDLENRERVTMASKC